MDLATDDNNNTPGEKSYSLRPRTSTKRGEEDLDEEESWKPIGRGRRKQKQKSAPLSKYRRKTANARERSRMREINDAFEALRKAIPHLASSSDCTNEKISKIMTLRLAMKYITALSNALEEPESYSLDFQTTLSLMDNSSTTSSISDHVTWRDQLFTSTPPLESTSSLDSPLSCSGRHYAITNKVNLDSNSKALPSLPHINNQSPSDKFLHFFSRASESTSSSSARNQQDTSHTHRSEQRQLRHTELSRLTLTPPEESVLNFTDDFHPGLASSTSEFQNPSSLFSTEFDGLPSPVMDFCDMFIT